MAYLLKAFGHRPLEAKDGAEGLAVLRRERPDLVLVDIHMPTMDGYEFARQVHADVTHRAIPLVAVTALAMAGDREKILSHGFNGYISKPVAPETLLAEIRKYLQPDRASTATAPQPDHPSTNPSQQLSERLIRGPAPISACPEAAAAAMAPTPEPQRPIILFVDNSKTNARVVQDTLEPSGYEIVTASSAQKGMALARNRKPDLIISDVHMPRQDGFDFLRSIMDDPELSQVPFLILTSSVWPERDRQMAFLRGAKNFLTRPIEPHRLLEEVAACLTKKKRSDT